MAADVLRDLPEDLAVQTLKQMKAAGGLMTFEFVALRDSMMASQAMGFVRRWPRS